jgi:hypothetical protein
METARTTRADKDVTRRTSNVTSNLSMRLAKIGHEVDTEVGVEARGDGGDGQLNPISDR